MKLQYKGFLGVVVVLAMMIVAVPAMASNDTVAVLWFDQPTQEEYNQVVDDLVQTKAALEKAEVKEYEEKHLALAVAAGVFIASGGVSAVVELLFPLCKIIPFL